MSSAICVERNNGRTKIRARRFGQACQRLVALRSFGARRIDALQHSVCTPERRTECMQELKFENEKE